MSFEPCPKCGEYVYYEDGQFNRSHMCENSKTEIATARKQWASDCPKCSSIYYANDDSFTHDGRHICRCSVCGKIWVMKR